MTTSTCAAARPQSEKILLETLCAHPEHVETARAEGLEAGHFRDREHRFAFKELLAGRRASSIQPIKSDDPDSHVRRFTREVIAKSGNTAGLASTDQSTVVRSAPGEMPREIVWLIQVVLDRELARLSPISFHVAFVISQLWNVQTGYAWPSHKQIADKLELSIEGVRKMILRLQGHGHLNVHVSRGRGRSNHYVPVLKPGTARKLFDKPRPVVTAPANASPALPGRAAIAEPTYDFHDDVAF